jgi:hypothetical protein
LKINKNIEILLMQKVTGLSKNQLFLNNYFLKEQEQEEFKKLKQRYLK